MKHYLPLVAAAVALAPLAPAMASPDDLTIDYSDLDLAKKSDVNKLDRRIRTAARAHCNADSTRTGSRLRAPAALKCAQQFEAEARKQFAALVEAEQKGG